MAALKPGRIEKATRLQFREAGISVQDNALAATAVMLARALDDGVGARDAAAVARELRATVTELTRESAKTPARTGLDELRARREARRGAG